MVKLNRFTMPVFAGNAAQTQTSVFGTMKTSPQYTTDVAASIGTTAYGNGWNDAIDLGYAPFIEDMNTLQRAITYQISYNQQQGIPEWDANTEYYKGSLAKYNTATGSQVYSSLIDNNVGNLVSDATKWKLLFDTENSYVTTNTAQTITGAKTFEVNSVSADAFFIKNKAIDRGVVPSNNIHTRIYFKDKNGDNVSCIYNNVGSNGEISLNLQAQKNDGSNNLTTGMGLVYPASGNPYAWCPNPTVTTTTNSTQIATAGWVNTVGNNVMHLTGNETITGRKVYTDTTTFTTHPVVQSTTEYSSIGYRVQNTQITRGTAPTTGNASGQWVFQGAGGLGVNNRIGGMEVTYLTDGSIRTSLQVFQPAASTTQNPYTYSNLSLIYPASGNPYTYCPASDVANSIVTTVNKNKSTNGYFQLGNGMIVQWGRTQIHVHTDKTVYTITLPKAFTSTNYTFCACFENNTSSSPAYTDDATFVTTSISKTQVKGFGYDAGNNYYDAYIRWIAIGY